MITLWDQLLGQTLEHGREESRARKEEGWVFKVKQAKTCIEIYSDTKQTQLLVVQEGIKSSQLCKSPASIEPEVEVTSFPEGLFEACDRN